MRAHALPPDLAIPVLAVAVLAGCPTDDLVVDDPEQLPDPTAALFDPDRLLDVAIELDADDWETLRHQTRTAMGVLGGDCLGQPFESPFDYVPGAITIDGVTVDGVGVRKKGFLGSLSSEKPSLKVKLHEYDDVASPWGVRRLTFNNGRQDPSLIKQCLGYDVMRAAGQPASRCTFAHVVVNGEDLGVYAHVETVRETVLSRYYDDDGGSLYEGTLSDFRDGWTATFEHKRGPDAGDAIEAVSDALLVADDDLDAALDPWVDLDAFVRFWALEALVGHWDGYAGNTNNYFLYRDPADERFEFLPWGIDGIFFGDNPFGEQLPTAVTANAALPHRLYAHPVFRDRYLDELLHHLDAHWDEARLLDEIERMRALIEPAIGSAASEDFDAAVDAVAVFVETRRAIVEDELAGGPPTIPDELRASPCFAEVGTMRGGFTTGWDTFAYDPFAVGSGWLEVTWDGTPLTFESFGAVAGPDPPAGTTVFAMIATMPDAQYLVPYLSVDPALAAPDATIALDWVSATGLLGYAGPTTGGEVVVGAYVGEGTLEIEQFADEPFATVVGSFEGTLVTGGN